MQRARVQHLLLVVETLDDHSSMNLRGASAMPLSGENDLAQNPFDLGAEHGPSLFDARHRLSAAQLGNPFARQPRGRISKICGRLAVQRYRHA